MSAPPAWTGDVRTVVRIIACLRPYARLRNTLLLLVLLRAAQKPALAWAAAALINGPITHGNAPAAFLGAIGFLALGWFVEATAYFRQRQTLELGERVARDLRDTVFEHLQRLPIKYFHETKLGSILSHFINDVEAVRRGLQSACFLSLLLLGQMVVSAFVMICYDGRLFGILLAVSPLILLIQYFFHPRFSADSRQAAESQSRLAGTLAEAVRGMRVIQAYTREERSAELYAMQVDSLAEANLNVAGRVALYLPLLDFTSQIFAAALLTVGGYWVLAGGRGLEIGSLIAFLFLPALFFQSLQGLANLYPQALAAIAGAKRVFAFLDAPPSWSDRPEARDLPDPRSESPADDRLSGGAQVEFRNVTFGYDPAKPVLHEISFLVPPGRTTALVGPTGGGKSSIINLMTKFHLPCSGELFVDQCEIRDLTGDSLHRQIGLVPQASFLFTGTVLDNIRFGRPNASDGEIYEAARSLDCFDVLSHLPQGFQTPVSGGGANLSMGQRQLISLLRAWLCDPRLLILDEATSSMDMLTEARIQRALCRLLARRTSFVVAHRLSTIIRADQILVLDRGRIVESGTHSTLLAQDGLYRQLHRRFAA